MSSRFIGVATTIAAAALLAGCAAPADSADQSLTFVIEGANLSAGHMDPHSSQLDVSALVGRNVLDSLVSETREGEFVPWLAKSWEISADERTYTFHLRDDVTFTDGEKFNAAAVKANFDHITAKETASAHAASMLGVDSGYESTDVIDDYTVAVKFSQPYAPFLQAASTSLLGFYSPAVLEKSADKLKTGGPDVTIGTGPFILCLLYTSPSPRDRQKSRMPSSA